MVALIGSAVQAGVHGVVVGAFDFLCRAGAAGPGSGVGHPKAWIARGRRGERGDPARQRRPEGDRPRAGGTADVLHHQDEPGRAAAAEGGGLGGGAAGEGAAVGFEQGDVGTGQGALEADRVGVLGAVVAGTAADLDVAGADRGEAFEGRLHFGGRGFVWERRGGGGGVVGGEEDLFFLGGLRAWEMSSVPPDRSDVRAGHDARAFDPLPDSERAIAR